MRKTTSGFTIVELLIVIVVIAILAAISIVAYNGIQNRGKTSAAQSAATNAIKKAELYSTDIGNYPTTIGALTSASSSTVYQLSGVNPTTPLSSLSDLSSQDTIAFQVCGQGVSAAPTSLPQIDSSNVVGIRVYYRNYGTGNLALTAGVTSGTNIGCVTSAS